MPLPNGGTPSEYNLCINMMSSFQRSDCAILLTFAASLAPAGRSAHGLLKDLSGPTLNEPADFIDKVGTTQPAAVGGIFNKHRRAAKSPGRVGPSFLQKEEANTMACEEAVLPRSLSDEATSLPVFTKRPHSYREV